MIDSDSVTSHFQPLIECEDRWYTFCFGGNLETIDSELVSDEGMMPLVSILLSMSQVAILQLLDYHVDWLEQKSTFTYHQGRWLYALLTCVELPLIPETCSTVRTLARECSRIRATLDPADENTLDQLNFFICLVTKYFRQYDLGEVL
uniref:Gem-associated protein 2 n=1 Tax=Timema tahoe TaxID=61484 RepID=A0A7R9P0N4_9NEOP|nr:unnamed protein product [Timema tahoe]